MATEQYKPEQPNIYQGKQIVINSDRILFNAKKDSVLMYADKSIGFCTNGTINFDTGLSSTNAFIVNSPNILLGLEDNILIPVQPAVLGNSLELYLIQMIELIELTITWLKTRYNVTSNEPGLLSDTGVNETSGIDELILELKRRVKTDIKSKNVKLI